MAAVLSQAFTEKFDIHFIPSSTERGQIFDIILSALDKQSQIDEKIRRFQVLIDDLYLQREAIDHYIEKHRAMISGMRRLPLELLQTIFYHCLPARNATMEASEAPLLLGRICRAWRQITFTTPELWSSLHICIPTVSVPRHLLDSEHFRPKDHALQKMQQQGEAIEAWLHRSSNNPLSLSIYSSEGDFESDTSTMITHSLLNVLVRYSSRWKNVAIHVSIRNGLVPLTTLREADFPSLEALRLDVDSPVPSEAWDSLSLFHSPCLRSASFTYSRTLSVRWENLTQLILSSRHPSDLLAPDALNILRACPKLIICQLSVEIYAVSPDMGSATMPSLQVLRILPIITWDTVTQMDSPPFFSALNLPTLRHFEFNPGSQQFPPVPFKLLLTRHIILETLEYSFTDFPSAELTEILTLCRSLKRLRLTIRGYDVWGSSTPVPLCDNFIISLTPNSSSGTPICPCLEEVDMGMNLSCNLTDEIALRFLLSRTIHAPPGVEHLRRVKFEFQRPYSVDIMPRIKPAIERGLQLDLSYTARAQPIPVAYDYSHQSGIYLATEEFDRDFWREPWRARHDYYY